MWKNMLRKREYFGKYADSALKIAGLYEFSNKKIGTSINIWMYRFLYILTFYMAKSQYFDAILSNFKTD